MEDHKIDQTEAEKIDLIRLLQEFSRALRRLIWLPVILALALGCLSGLRNWRSYRPMYASEVTFTIRMADTTLTDISGSTSYYSKATAEQLSKTFPYILQSDLMRSMLRREMGTDWVNGSVTARTVSNTNLFTLRVTSSSAQDAYDILCTVIKVYPRVADYVIGTTCMDLLTEPAVAAAPYNEFRPVPTIVKGAVMGALLGLLGVLAYAATRSSIREAGEIHEKLNQTCLAVLPKVTFKRRSQAVSQMVSVQNEKISGAFQESVRSMRIKFLREAEKHAARVVMVTSTLPGEGKTTVAVNLALTLSRNGARVILVDLDLRNPSVKKALGVTAPSRGMPELLDGDKANVLDCLLPVEGTSLRLLAGDQPAADARRQTGSRRLAALLETLRQEADFIVLDTPPCGLVADSAAMARSADGIIYVLRSGVAQVSHVMDNLQLLSDSGTRLMGCVLNGSQGSRGGYGYGYGYGYGGYYGKYSSRHGKRMEEKDKGGTA